MSRHLGGGKDRQHGGSGGKGPSERRDQARPGPVSGAGRLPLPAETARLVLDSACENLAVFFQKFVDYPGGWQFTQKEQHKFLERFVGKATQASKSVSELLGIYRKRREALLNFLKREREIVPLSFTVTWRLCTGLGSGTVLEGSGMLFHPILGVPYIPASSLKGVLGSYLRLDRGWQENADEYQAIFGGRDRRGGVEFLDALPEGLPKFEVDIVNCHYPKYYQGTAPPGDWQDPNPVYFLTVGKDTKFSTALVADDRKLVEQCATLFKEAIQVLGLGAKTRSGYGEVAVIP